MIIAVRLRDIPFEQLVEECPLAQITATRALKQGLDISNMIEPWELVRGQKVLIETTSYRELPNLPCKVWRVTEQARADLERRRRPLPGMEVGTHVCAVHQVEAD